MKRFSGIIALLLLFSVQTHAEIRIALSLEWLSCKADAIILGKVTSIKTTKGPGAVIYEDCTIQIDKVFKGDIKEKELTFCLRTLSSEPTGKDYMNSKEGVLFFLSKSKDHGNEKRLDNQYIPTSQHSPFSIFNLSRIPKGIYGKEMTLLTHKPQILDVVKKWGTSTISDSLRLEVPCDSPVFRELYSFSSCYLIVPAEEKYRSVLMKQAHSKNINIRRQAARELRKYPGKETVALLRELLKDTGEIEWQSANDTISEIEYGVRSEAYDSLKALGEPVPADIQRTRKPTVAEQKALCKKAWTQSFNEFLPDGWAIRSVESGPVWHIAGVRAPIVKVTCGEGDVQCVFTIIPKGMDKSHFPKGEENLGINGGKDNQNGRFFFLKGSLPKDLKEKVIQYFGLE